MDKIIIYTDGSCLGNPGKGGWAAKLMIEKNGKLSSIPAHIKFISGCSKHSTNNIMELTAVLKALKELKTSAKNYIVEIYTDSQYVQKGLTQWRDSWEYRNFKGVKNSDLWKELIDLYSEFEKKTKISIHYVKAHDVNQHNNEVDKLAREKATKC